MAAVAEPVTHKERDHLLEQMELPTLAEAAVAVLLAMEELPTVRINVQMVDLVDLELQLCATCLQRRVLQYCQPRQIVVSQTQIA